MHSQHRLSESLQKDRHIQHQNRWRRWAIIAFQASIPTKAVSAGPLKRQRIRAKEKWRVSLKHLGLDENSWEFLLWSVTCWRQTQTFLATQPIVRLVLPWSQKFSLTFVGKRGVTAPDFRFLLLPPVSPKYIQVSNNFAPFLRWLWNPPSPPKGTSVLVVSH